MLLKPEDSVESVGGKISIFQQTGEILNKKLGERSDGRFYQL